MIGHVEVSGAKNSALKLLAATILTNNNVEIFNSPNELLDMKIHIGMLEKIGKKCVIKGDNILIKENGKIANELIWGKKSIRNTLLILGALISRIGRGSVPLPGGCNIGDRKYDLHTMILEKMGAKVWEEQGYIHAKTKNKLKGSEIHLPIRSTGATENGILCGVLAEGETIIWNPHIRPEVIDLIKMLNNMGANINVFGQKCIVIQGVDQLHGTTHTVIPDNLEAITWAIGSVITNGEIEIFNFPIQSLEVPLIFLKESGMKYYFGNNSIIVKGGVPYPIEISTGPYPGINSDMQPLFAIYGSCSEGNTKIIDLRFPGRYGYANELGKMGLNFSIIGDVLSIQGGTQLIGTHVKAIDLRTGIALLLAGMVAEAETTIHDSWQIDRGYNKLYSKLKKLS